MHFQPQDRASHYRRQFLGDVVFDPHLVFSAGGNPANFHKTSIVRDLVFRCRAVAVYRRDKERFDGYIFVLPDAVARKVRVFVDPDGEPGFRKIGGAGDRTC